MRNRRFGGAVGLGFATQAGRRRAARAISAAVAVVSPVVATAATQYYDTGGTVPTITTGSDTVSTTSTNFTSTDATPVAGAMFASNNTAVFAGTGATASNASAAAAGTDGTSSGNLSSYIVTFGSAITAGATSGTVTSGLVINNSGYYFNASSTANVVNIATALSTGAAGTNANSGVFLAASKTADFGNNLSVLFSSASGFGQRAMLGAGSTLNIDTGAVFNKSAGVAQNLIFGYAGTAGAAATVNVAGTITRLSTGDTASIVVGQYVGEVDVNVNSGGVISTAGTGLAGTSHTGSIGLGAFNTSTGTVTGALNINAGGSVVASDTTTTDAYAGVELGVSTGGAGIVNLNASGTLTTQKVLKGAGTGTFNFNGGSIVANANTTAFMTGLTTANVLAGGATFNTNLFNITVGQNLLAGTTSTGGGLTVTGGGTLTLSGTETYTGVTNVSAGTLALSSGTNNIANSAKVYVATGATLSVAGITGGFALATGQTLAGGGTVTGGTTVGSGATITGGTGATAADTIGTLTTGPATLAGGTYAVKLDGTNAATEAHAGAGDAGAGTSDLLLIGGLTAASTSLTINPVGVSTDVSGKLTTPGGGPYSFLIAQIPAANVSSTSSFNASSLSLSVTQTNGVSPAGTYVLSAGLDGSSNDDLFLDFTPAAAPEPTSVLLLGVALAPLTVGRRRRRHVAGTTPAD